MNRPDEPTRQNDAQATDADLAIAAMRGDSEAFGVLIVRLRSAVIGYVAGLIRNQDEAEDIAQEAFLAAWRNLGGLREPACVGHWIFRIAHNLATKRAKRRPDISLAFDPAIPVPDPRGQERLLGLLAAVGRLSEEHREVIMRKHLVATSTSR